MADQARWFKLWCSAPSDDHLQALCPADRWAWAAFGAYTKLHGTAGEVIVSSTNQALAAQLGVPTEELIRCLERLPHMTVTARDNVRDNGRQNRNGEFAVTVLVSWHNWSKYQEDSTGAERLKRFRMKRSKKRREEKRREVPPKPPASGGLLASPVTDDMCWPDGCVRTEFLEHFPIGTRRQCQAHRAHA